MEWPGHGVCKNKQPVIAGQHFLGLQWIFAGESYLCPDDRDPSLIDNSPADAPRRFLLRLLLVRKLLIGLLGTGSGRVWILPRQSRNAAQHDAQAH